jgi:general L-amino acid transport system permease protein
MPCFDAAIIGPATVFRQRPDRPPPLQSIGPVDWVVRNLFDGWFNSLLTVAALAFLWAIVPPLVSWALWNAQWTAPAGGCPPEAPGACWAFITEKFRVLMVGLYPSEALWRPACAAVMLALLTVVSVLRLLTTLRMLVLWSLLPLALFGLINGGLGLAVVDQSMWGGLMLSLFLALVGILVSLPLGILLALGRQSHLPAIRAVCVGVIEPVRGVPLITILFMASVMMPLFLPAGMEINNLLRVQAGIILFSAAYMAEVVRGGLQAIGVGQLEAAKALGLGYWQTTFLVVLPQALRHVIPSLIGRCIALFKDTSLVIIVGLLDFLGMVKASAQDPQWLGHDAEAYVFCALTYWAICFGMSRYGRSLETRRAAGLPPEASRR